VHTVFGGFDGQLDARSRSLDAATPQRGVEVHAQLHGAQAIGTDVMPEARRDAGHAAGASQST
jgi:hypothetical protein